MNLIVNGKMQKLNSGHTLRALLEELGKSELRGIAAAVNGTVVPLTEWSAYTLFDGDEVLIIQATQGG